MTDQPTTPTCPWCGAKQVYRYPNGGSDYHCGSFVRDEVKCQSAVCKDRVIARQAKEIEALKSERKQCLQILGLDYAGEFDLPVEKQRPLDSMVVEFLRQKDNTIADLDSDLARLREEAERQTSEASNLEILVRRLCHQIKEESSVKSAALDYLKRTGREGSVLRVEGDER